MQPMEIPPLLGLIAFLLGAAKLFGAAAQRLGQPAVLGELLTGVLAGASVLGWVDTRNEVMHTFADIGVVILLFEIGLETDLRKLLEVGGASTVVALAGVALPGIGGYVICRLLGQANLLALMGGAALTATSVGITARVLADLGRLHEPESRIVLGAAILDDVIGLVILTVVAGLTRGQEVTALGVARVAAVAVGFLVATLVVGRFVVPPLFRVASRIDLPGTAVVLAVMLAFGLAWLAAEAGSAVLLGGFAAGLLLAGTEHARAAQRQLAGLGHFFVPLFFVGVGAAVDLRVLNPVDPANRPMLLVGGLLILVAVLGKFLAGYAPFWFRGRKSVIGAGMVPRGEVGLIFAQTGLASGVFDQGLFSAVTFMVIVTTFLGPLLLKRLLPPRRTAAVQPQPEGLQALVTQP